jgi:hypothetical protein
MRRAAIIFTVVAVLASAIAAYAAVAGHGSTTTKKADSFGITLRTSAKLYPGVRGRVTFTFHNRRKFALLLRSLKVTVGNPSLFCRSTALVVGRYTGRRKLGARRDTLLSLPIQMSKRASNACKGASFKLTVRGHATKAAPSKSRTRGLP